MSVAHHTARVFYFLRDSQNTVLIKFIYVLPESRNKNIQAEILGQARKTEPNKIENVMPNSLNGQKVEFH